MQNNHRIIIGDSRDMPELSDHTVQLIATSPPYWELKDYGHEGQIGFDQTYEAYINNLNLVWLECGRVLQDGCRLCINIGDQFARSAYYGRYKVIPIRTEIIRFCETIGFDYMGAIIWQKVTTCNTSGGASIMGSFPYPRNGILKIDYEFILIFRKPGDAPPVDKATKEASKLTKEEWSTYFNGHWNFPGERGSKHLAAFPQELPHRLIKMFSFVGDTVLDPFLGSGTTALAAKHLHRDSVGYELNAEFVPIIEEKIGVRQADMFDVATVQLEHRKEVCNFTERLERLPYHFHDPVTFERRVDPRSLQFGSRVYEDQVDTRDFYKVTGIMAPDLLELDNQLTVRLLGIKVAARHRQEAITFLEEKTKGHKVFFKLDATEFDDNGHLCCYLYLKNKTFLNAHLIKRGLAQADTDNMYRLRKRFMRYAEEAKSKT